jgi:hypothetical protein
MATEAQVLANRRNAERSTGPRTADGKAVSAQNAVKHGLTAKDAVIRGEDSGEFESYREQMLEELAPVGAVELVLAARIVGLTWRLQRAERMQNLVVESMLVDNAKPISGIPCAPERGGKAETEQEVDIALGWVTRRDFADGRVLDRLSMYERRIEHSLYRTMAELTRLRLLRELEQSEDGGQKAEDRGQGTALVACPSGHIVERLVASPRHSLLTPARSGASLPMSCPATLRTQNEPNCVDRSDGEGHQGHNGKAGGTGPEPPARPATGASEFG